MTLHDQVSIIYMNGLIMSFYGHCGGLTMRIMTFVVGAPLKPNKQTSRIIFTPCICDEHREAENYTENSRRTAQHQRRRRLCCICGRAVRIWPAGYRGAIWPDGRPARSVFGRAVSGVRDALSVAPRRTAAGCGSSDAFRRAADAPRRRSLGRPGRPSTPEERRDLSSLGA